MGQIPEEREMSWLDGWLDAVREGPYGKGDQEAVRIIEKLMKAEQRAERVEAERERLKLEAELWAQEARSQRATVQEIYQLCSGATGEPGDWNGAEPVRQVIRERDTARKGEAKLREAVLVGLGAAKFCNMSPEVIDKMTEALHSSDAPASEPEGGELQSLLQECGYNVPDHPVPVTHGPCAEDHAPADRPQEQTQGGTYKRVPAEPTLEWAERLLEIPAADGHAEATYMIEKVIETAPDVGEPYSTMDYGGVGHDPAPADRPEIDYWSRGHSMAKETAQTDAQRDALEALDELAGRARGSLMDHRPQVSEWKETVRQYILSQSGQAVPEALINRIVPPMDEMSEADERRYPAEAALYHDRNRIRRELRQALSHPVPDAVRRLPTELRERGDAIAQSDLHDSECSAQANGWHFAADVVEHALSKHPADGDSPAVPDGMEFHRAMQACKRGLEAWSSKPHNKKWWKRIHGTPIPNDLLVEIALQFAAAPTPDEDGE